MLIRELGAYAIGRQAPYYNSTASFSRASLSRKALPDRFLARISRIQSRGPFSLGRRTLYLRARLRSPSCIAKMIALAESPLRSSAVHIGPSAPKDKRWGRAIRIRRIKLGQFFFCLALISAPTRRNSFGQFRSVAGNILQENF